MSTVHREPGSRLALYNPAQLSKSQLIAQFVARTALLDRLLDDLRRGQPGDSNQHHLLVGPRGMGKTMILHRLRYAIDDDPELSRHWLPLVFPEEQYNVARLSDLWVNCLDALGDALEARNRKREAEELDALIDRLPRDDEDRRARQALAALDRWAERERLGLVLLVDNVDMVLDTLDDDQQWTLRSTLSAGHRLLFIGASARVTEATYRYRKAFYDFFRVHSLRGLDEAEARALSLKLAELCGTPEVARLIEQDPARFKTLHKLTGGNARTLVIVYEILVQGEGADVGSDLERVLDQHTPLYKARFDDMPPQARQVVVALALHWDPMPAADLAREVRLDVKQVSAQLTRLVQQQIVEPVPYPPGRKRAYQVAERFFNIWYLMRAGRRSRSKLLWLVKFYKLLYSPTQVGDRARSLAEDRRDYLNTLAWFLCRNGGDYEEATELARRAVALAPDNLDVAYTFAAVLMKQGLWPEAVAQARRFISEGDPAFHARIWPAILTFFRDAVRAGHAGDAVRLLDETGYDVRWRPLREALNAVAQNDPESFQRLAPEVREPALDVFRLLTQAPPADSSTKSPKRRKRRGR